MNSIPVTSPDSICRKESRCLVRSSISKPNTRGAHKEFELLTVEHQSVQMLSLWMLANSAHNDIFSEEVAVRLIEIANKLDNELQFIAHGTLGNERYGGRTSIL